MFERTFRWLLLAGLVVLSQALGWATTDRLLHGALPPTP